MVSRQVRLFGVAGLNLLGKHEHCLMATSSPFLDADFLSFYYNLTRLVKRLIVAKAHTVLSVSRVGQNRMYAPYMTILFDDFPAKNTVYLWFWPTLDISSMKM